MRAGNAARTARPVIELAGGLRSARFYLTTRAGAHLAPIGCGPRRPGELTATAIVRYPLYLVIRGR